MVVGDIALQLFVLEQELIANLNSLSIVSKLKLGLNGKYHPFVKGACYLEVI